MQGGFQMSAVTITLVGVAAYQYQRYFDKGGVNHMS